MAAPVHGSKTSAADTNNPPDSPLAFGGVPAEPTSGQQGPAIPLESERALEDMIRTAQRHALQKQAFAQATNDARMAVGFQTLWITFGVVVARRGYRFADPMRSMIKPYTDNIALCKVMNPFSVIGGIMAGVTMWQLPGDIRFLMDAWRAEREEEQAVAALVEKRRSLLASLGLTGPNALQQADSAGTGKNPTA